jgi:hypothetical protein
MDSSSTKERAMSECILNDRVQQYLRSMLTLESKDWGSQGPPLRQAFVSQSTPASAGLDSETSPSEPAPLIRLIADCRSQFWRPDSIRLFEELDAHMFERAPELAQVAVRLSSWFRVRDQLQMLLSQMGAKSLAHALHDMATMTAREISISKAGVASRLQKGKARDTVRQAKRIRAEFPNVYSLDPEWFDELIAFSRRG